MSQPPRVKVTRGEQVDRSLVNLLETLNVVGRVAEAITEYDRALDRLLSKLVQLAKELKEATRSEHGRNQADR